MEEACCETTTDILARVYTKAKKYPYRKENSVEQNNIFPHLSTYTCDPEFSHEALPFVRKYP